MPNATANPILPARRFMSGLHARRGAVDVEVFDVFSAGAIRVTERNSS
jgi:hypothetical protein